MKSTHESCTPEFKKWFMETVIVEDELNQLFEKIKANDASMTPQEVLGALTKLGI